MAKRSRRSHAVVFRCTSIVLCGNIENMAFILQKKHRGSAAASCRILYSFIAASDPDLPSARCLISRHHDAGLHLLPCVCSVSALSFCRVLPSCRRRRLRIVFHFIFTLLHFASSLRPSFCCSPVRSGPASCPATPRTSGGASRVLSPSCFGNTRSNNKM